MKRQNKTLKTRAQGESLVHKTSVPTHFEHNCNIMNDAPRGSRDCNATLCTFRSKNSEGF